MLAISRGLGECGVEEGDEEKECRQTHTREMESEQIGPTYLPTIRRAV
jgi:hypothetical protein